MTESTLNLIEQRRRAKGRDEAEYQQLNHRVQQVCRKGREAFPDRTCENIQKCADRNDSSMLFRKIRQITRDFKSRVREIKDGNGAVLWNKHRILGRWKMCCQQLYQNNVDGNPANGLPALALDGEDEADILMDEVREPVYEESATKFKNFPILKIFPDF